MINNPNDAHHSTASPAAPAATAATAVTAAATARRIVDSPVGPLTLEAGPDGLRSILFGAMGDMSTASDAHLDTRTAAHLHAPIDGHLDAAERQLAEYFAGERQHFELTLDPHGTEFQRAAWQQLRGIAYGETITYGEQARRLGDARKSRAVGAANGRNPLPIVVPCHRVVGANGSLTGFAGGLDTKAWLLDHERVTLAAS